MRIVLYIAAIVLANILTTLIAPTNILGIIVPAGSWLIGATFILRDWVQMGYGRSAAYVSIMFALVISALVALHMGQGLMIVLASAISFVVSESADTEVYTRLRMPVHARVLWSGIAGGILDSVLFIVIAGFPLQAIIGQLVIKVLMQAIGAYAIKWRTNA
jgi:uncharacterized PurR-regulated membrane protein YhhQ (DUF165 family)